MNDILKQRLVGALILVALGVVFWPIIFVQPEKEKMAEQQSIPPPEVSTAEIQAPGPHDLRDSPELAAQSESPVLDTSELPGGEASDATNAAVPAEVQTPDAQPDAGPESAAEPAAGSGAVRVEAPQRLAMDNAGVPVAWTLQVATVSSAEKADDLRRQLIAMHQKAYVTTVSSGGKRLYRVSIGPKFERVELESLRASINAKFGVNSMVARYVP